jgi:hypothetical protein
MIIIFICCELGGNRECVIMEIRGRERGVVMRRFGRGV